ncbi:hypothetical protein ABZ897_15955 [Nonomuraea sp. NPDC046802]|uniref:hypothetical protein n=1 Tax=Nonomuraea sp. NPDC046802 TaxID=3154919 RepID=UPI0033DFBB0C
MSDARSPDQVWADTVRAVEAFFEQQRREREAFEASPAQVAARAAIRERRSAGARRGWDKRRAAAHAHEEEQCRLDELEKAARQGGPTCEAWDSPGPPYPSEVLCSLPAEHAGSPHENVLYGHTWEEDE